MLRNQGPKFTDWHSTARRWHGVPKRRALRTHVNRKRWKSHDVPIGLGLPVRSDKETQSGVSVTSSSIIWEVQRDLIDIQSHNAPRLHTLYNLPGKDVGIPIVRKSSAIASVQARGPINTHIFREG